MAISFKYLFLWAISLVLLAGCEKSVQKSIISVPDQAFLGALIAQGVDKDEDGQISQTEAEAIASLVIPPSGISDLTGLEAFIHLESFSITLNPLASLDISKNLSLSHLECTSCELTQLDVSRNTALETLICGRNSLEELDLSQNVALSKLVCNNNLFTSLDLSANTGLTLMISCGNQLTSLDISMLTSLTKVGYDNMPMLDEVCVWSLPFPPPGLVVLSEFSPNLIYTTQCSK